MSSIWKETEISQSISGYVVSNTGHHSLTVCGLRTILPEEYTFKLKQNIREGGPGRSSHCNFLNIIDDELGFLFLHQKKITKTSDENDRKGDFG